MAKYRTDCRFFSGYRPCGFGEDCMDCGDFRPATPEVLLINLDAMGDVLRTTALLPAIMRQHPNARISWLTRARAAPMLRGNPLVHRVLEWGPDAFAALQVLEFDLVLNADKSLAAGSMAMSVKAAERRGFGVDSSGAIVPLNDEALHLYELGLNNHAKFNLNQRTAPDLLAEALGFVHERDGYSLSLERSSTLPKHRVGLNTGCGAAWPLKRMGRRVCVELIDRLADSLGEPILLLGGPEDDAEHQFLLAELPDKVVSTELTRGVMQGASDVDRCDVVVTGDSLGMHMAIALHKHVVAWFGPTCPAEIDLYDRGVKVLAEVDCAPCYRSVCDQPRFCSDRIDVPTLHQSVLDCLHARERGQAIDEVRGASWWQPNPV